MGVYFWGAACWGESPACAPLYRTQTRPWETSARQSLYFTCVYPYRLGWPEFSEHIVMPVMAFSFMGSGTPESCRHFTMAMPLIFGWPSYLISPRRGHGILVTASFCSMWRASRLGILGLCQRLRRCNPLHPICTWRSQFAGNLKFTVLMALDA